MCINYRNKCCRAPINALTFIASVNTSRLSYHIDKYTIASIYSSRRFPVVHPVSEIVKLDIKP